jgi:hypothetical protein
VIVLMFVPIMTEATIAIAIRAAAVARSGPLAVLGRRNLTRACIGGPSLQ